MPRPNLSRWHLALIAVPLSAVAAAAAAMPQPTAPDPGAPVMLASSAVTIEAPGTVDPGQPVAVTVSGGQPDGRLELWGPNEGKGAKDRISTQPVASGPATVTAPLAAGSYELRYYDRAGRLVARTGMDVAATPIILSVPVSVFGAGYANEVRWTGPGAPGDMIQVFDPRTGVVVSETPAVGRFGAVNIAMVQAPEAHGEYEVRYWSGANRAVLRSIGITVGEGIAWLRSPVEVFVRERFAVKWNGPVRPEESFELFDPATGAVVASAPAGAGDQGASATLTAPSRPGAYRIRYVNTATGYMLADLPLDVDRK